MLVILASNPMCAASVSQCPTWEGPSALPCNVGPLAELVNTDHLYLLIIIIYIYIYIIDRFT